MVVIVMTKKQVEEYHKKLDEWWDELDYDIKGDIRRLVYTVQNPIDQNLPVEYADADDDFVDMSSMTQAELTEYMKNWVIGDK